MSAEFIDQIWFLLFTLLKIAGILLVLILGVAYYTYAERKVIGAMQVRKGPTRVGFFGFKLFGLGQPIADVVKLLLKEIIIPANANRFLFLLAPVLALAPAFAAWAVIPADGWFWQISMPAFFISWR